MLCSPTSATMVCTPPGRPSTVTPGALVCRVAARDDVLLVYYLVSSVKCRAGSSRAVFLQCTVTTDSGPTARHAGNTQDVDFWKAGLILPHACAGSRRSGCCDLRRRAPILVSYACGIGFSQLKCFFNTSGKASHMTTKAQPAFTLPSVCQSAPAVHGQLVDSSATCTTAAAGSAARPRCTRGTQRAAYCAAGWRAQSA